MVLRILSFVGLIAFHTGCVQPEDLQDPKEKEYDSFSITAVTSITTQADANPEIIRMIPGSTTQALAVSSASKSLTLLNYTATTLEAADVYFFLQDSAEAELTSIDISPDGLTVAVLVANADCAKGSVIFANVADGSTVSTVEVGYNPDSAAFSKDGRYLVVANEDDREDRACKPADRKGGSVSIVDLQSGIAAASVVQEIAVAHDTDSEPEGVKISPDNNTVIVAVQETSEVGFFNLADVPNAALSLLDIPEIDGNAAEPDGLAFSPDGTIGVVSNERNGSFTLVNMADKTLYGTYEIENDSTIVSYSGNTSYFSSPPYNVDARKSTKRTEPEETNVVTKTDKMYALFALQEAHGIIVFDITDPTAPVFDSIAPSGINWAEDTGMEKSDIGSEGLATHPTTGAVLVANEREGSITLMKASWTDDSL